MRRFVIPRNDRVYSFCSRCPHSHSPRTPALKLTVVDPTGAVLAGADVTIVAGDAAAAPRERSEEGSADRRRRCPPQSDSSRPAVT